MDWYPLLMEELLLREIREWGLCVWVSGTAIELRHMESEDTASRAFSE